MNTYLSDEMVDKFKILVLYVLKDIKIVDIKKHIGKIFDKYFMTRINYIPHLPNYSYKCLYTKSTYQP